MSLKRSFIAGELPTGNKFKIAGHKSPAKTKFFKITYGSASGWVPQKMFVAMKAEARTRLQKQGVVITSNKDWAAIVEAIEEVRQFKRKPLIEEPGWCGPYYADKTGKIFSPPGLERGITVFEPALATSSFKGTWKGWRDEVASPLTGQVIPMVAIMAALAAPFLKLIGEPYNFGFEFCGPPATGKTSSLAVMASVWGNPAHIPNFNATLAGLEGMFTEHQDRGFPIDEANLVDGRNANFFKEMAFRLANGSVKVTAFQPDRAYYRFIFATTANLPFPETLTGFDMDTAGAALQRLFPLRIPASNEFGVFDFLPEGFPDSGALASHLHDAIGRQHGTPMKRFLKCLVDRRAKNASSLREGIAKRIRRFEVAVGIAETARGKSRASSAFGLLYAAGSFAQHEKILPEGWDCLAACVAGYRNYQSLLPDQTPLATRLLTIALQPTTLDLRGQKLPRLTDAEMARHGAFLRQGKHKQVELLILPELRETFFRDWPKLSQSADFKLLKVKGGDHIGTHRQVRREQKRERFIIFVLPSGLGV